MWYYNNRNKTFILIMETILSFCLKLGCHVLSKDSLIEVIWIY